MGNRGKPTMQFSPMVPVTPVVKYLLMANIGIWVVIELILGKIILGDSELVPHVFGLVPTNVVHNFFVWELFTYMFIHALNPFHILFNMLLLWWLGSELEQRWGSKFFAVFYVVSGVGAAVFYLIGVVLYALVNSGVAPVWSTPVIGASGAIFGLMLAYGVIFGERIVYFMMMFPMRAKYFVMILGAVEIVTLLNNGLGNDVANLAHIGGIASGFLFLQAYTRFQQRKWRKKSGTRGRGLKLVVNNDDPGSPDRDPSGKTGKKDGPKYWN
jgi:membrane associated rhomboid family serine protease